MIDWFYVGRNAVWIIGAAMVLWSMSYARAVGEEIRRAQLTGLFMTAIGFASLSSRWWEATAWVVIAAAVAMSGIRAKA